MPAPFSPYDVPGVGTVIEHEGASYIVRLADGRVCGYPAQAGDASEASAAADIALAIANPPPAPAPVVLSRAEFIIALRRVLGITEGDVFALISQLPAGEQQETARDLWENAREFRRDNSFLAGLAALNGNTSEEIDEVFRTGAALNLD